MAELIGTAIGVVGILGQLFDGCVKAYGYFTTAAHLDVESQRLLCKVRIEEMRLVVWGREWGVADGRLEAHLRTEKNPQLRQLATQIMTELYSAITDFQRLQEKYGLVNQEEAMAGGQQPSEGQGIRLGKGAELESSSSGASTPSLTVPGAGKGEGKSHSRRNSRNGPAAPATSPGEKPGFNWRREITLRAKWVVADKDKFTNLLRDLKDFNDGLEQLFPPSRLPSLHRAWRHELLESAQRDLSELSLLEKASNGVYPQLNTSAELKKLRINLDAKPQAQFKPTFAFKVQRSALSLPESSSPSSAAAGGGGGGGATLAPPRLGGSASRTHGLHVPTGEAVIVEWVDYDRDDPDERFVHLRRLDDLARMMHSASDRHPDLHTIDCLGYVDDSASCRYGLVYRSPTLPPGAGAGAATSFDTLHALISSPDLKTPDLDERVRLARTLAVALWSLHSLDWLHKSLCSANIIFFPSALSAAATRATAAAAVVPDVSLPYLVGFDASRPDTDADMSVSPRNPSILDLHRHPGSVAGSGMSAAARPRRPYRKTYDIYSLGLVLLEIGLWKVLQTYYKPHYSAERWRDRIVLPVLVPGLGGKTGSMYRDVVERCLTAPEDMSSAEAGQLMESVVATLESINV